MQIAFSPSLSLRSFFSFQPQISHSALDILLQILVSLVSGLTYDLCIRVSFPSRLWIPSLPGKPIKAVTSKAMLGSEAVRDCLLEKSSLSSANPLCRCPCRPPADTTLDGAKVERHIHNRPSPKASADSPMLGLVGNLSRWLCCRSEGTRGGSCFSPRTWGEYGDFSQGILSTSILILSDSTPCPPWF